MTSSPSTTLREAGSPQSPRRRLGRRLSATHVLIAFVVILAFVLNLLVLQDRSSTVLVAIANEGIPAGSTLTSDSVRMVPVEAGFEGISSLVSEDTIALFEGHVFTRSLSAGTPVDVTALGEPGSAEGLRTMSVPLMVDHAAGGTLTAGDAVDVISVKDGVASYVATGLTVVGVSDSSSRAIGGSAGYHVIVSVHAAEALQLAEAIERGSIELVRATGANPIESVGTVDAP